MSADQLFTLPGVDPLPAKSTRSQFSDRQKQALAGGFHPLSLLFGYIKLHPNAPVADDKQAPGPRCGNCQFHEKNHRGYWKCFADNGARANHSPNSDARAWWPACVDYEPQDGA